MRLVLGFAVLFVSVTPAFAQGNFSVRGAADFSDGSLVGIPRGSIFTIDGAGLAPLTESASGLPLPTVLGGIGVSIWNRASGGDLVAKCPLWYVSPHQINAVLPSSLAPGQYYVSGVSPAFQFEAGAVAINVTDGRFAPFSQGGAGFGPAVAQQYDASGGPILNKLTAAATPGSTLVLWGTGLGALPSGSDADSPQAGTIRNDVTVYVDGLPATPLYAGRAPGLPGVDQINFLLPAGVRPRCFVPIQVTTGTATSEVSTIAISPGPPACPSEFGLPPSALASLDSGGVIRVDVLSFSSVTSSQDLLVLGNHLLQSLGTWEAQYDAAHLSALAVAGQPSRAKGLGVCHAGSIDRTHGLNPVVGSDLTVSVSGVSGCSWSSFGCAAASYQFGSNLAPFAVSGPLPPPRPADAIRSFSMQQSGQQETVSWAVSAGAQDGVTLIVGSSYTPATLHGTPTTYQRQLTCETSEADSPFTFPQAGLAWALYYADGYGPSMSLTTISDQVFPQNSPLVDLVLVRFANTVQALATPN